ncbi:MULTISPECIES: hypothetical protein [unclassified Duganella]|uniref:hypothetical protein n=1 Tax=unclassified Duganella TaxID=2636909 RepID=UPI0008916C4B|nr:MULTISPECIES: hypothetical protein [unclassified Duganella]SDH53476.1 hypothetical protein SAMN05216320_11520 [Duganella sp. OV458]SDK69347.1 hypothetical protein SAMN05428973_115108 [Duganella sp. OV510]
MPGLAIVVLLHLALLWLALRPVHQPVVRDNRIWLQLWQPPAKLTPAPPAVALPGSIPVSAIVLSPIARAVVSSGAAAPPAAVLAPAAPAPATASAAPAPASLADTPEVQALLAAPAPEKSLPPDVVRQALKDVAAIDRQLRAEHPQALTPPPGSPNARLARGIAAAGAAVKPKWFEQARIELFSAPNDPKRIYRVITAMGEYCLFYPDTGSISFNSAPKSGWAGSGQPTMSDCPTRF